MLEKLMRPAYQQFFVDPLAKFAGKYITPIQVTFLSGALGLGSALALSLHHTALAICLLILSGYGDTLDGTIARQFNRSSDFGGFLDVFIDRVVEAAMILSIWSLAPAERSLFSLLILTSVLLCVTSFLLTGIYSKQRGDKSFYYSPGLIERAEAFIFFILLMILPHCFDIIAGLFCILILWTTTQRIRTFYYSTH